jgi:hypothetical protein
MQLGPKALRTARGLGLWAFAAALTLSGFSLTARLAPYSDVSPVLAYLCGFAAVVACTLAVAAAAPSERAACAALAMLGVVGLLFVQRAGASSALAPAILLALLAFGSGLGAWVGGSIEEAGHLLFVALVSSAVDTFSVAHPDGPSAALLRQPQALALLALPWPMLGTRDVVPLLGVGDVVFASLYWAAGKRHALPRLRTLLALASGFALTALTVTLLERAIPVLPFLGVAIVAAHPEARRPQGRDMRRGLWLVTALGFALAVWVLRHSL